MKTFDEFARMHRHLYSQDYKKSPPDWTLIDFIGDLERRLESGDEHSIEEASLLAIVLQTHFLRNSEIEDSREIISLIFRSIRSQSTSSVYRLLSVLSLAHSRYLQDPMYTLTDLDKNMDYLKEEK